MGSPPAILVLKDGTVFQGISAGVEGMSIGEVVFNTAMTGYQEILTDPSYSRQLVTLTSPHIGNVGCNTEDMESGRMQAAGLIVRDLPARASNWRMQRSLTDWLGEQNAIAIAGIDTRRLTRLLRDKGAQDGCIMAGDIDVTSALAKAREFPGLQGMDLARTVSTLASYRWSEGLVRLPDDVSLTPRPQYHVVAYDYGVKRNILRLLVEHRCRVTVVPAMTCAADVLALKPDGVFLSNGPGDPESCDYAIEAAECFLRKRIPLFGICLGHQVLGLAGGARTVKMKFGHHGANHPVLELDTGRVLISTQNHGFAVDEASLPETFRVTHRSLFDGTLQGVAHRDAPAFSFQGHPEASPGPHDVRSLFGRFVEMMERGAGSPRDPGPGPRDPTVESAR